MHRLYSLVTYLLTPALMFYLGVRGISDRGWWKRWPERFGEFDGTGKMRGIVVHAASVGEVNAATPLIRKLGERWPDLPVTVTCFTATGSERIRSTFGSSVHHVYLPIDMPVAVRGFYNRLKPRLLIVMETEIWPNLFRIAHAAGIPILISNARLTEKSARGWSRFRGLVAAALQCPRLIAAQTEEDSQRYVALGANRDTTRVFGNLKFDIELPADLKRRGQMLRKAWGPDRIVLVAGSTHEEDEKALLEAFERLLETDPSALLVLVPRYPERFERVAESVRSAGFRTYSHSDGAEAAARAQCLVVDEMGVLLDYYAASDIAFVGGTLAEVGGHNPLEAAAMARPLIMGPNTAHIRQTALQLIESKAAAEITDTDSLHAVWKALQASQEKRQEMGRAALELVESERGALERNLEAVRALLFQ